MGENSIEEEALRTDSEEFDDVVTGLEIYGRSIQRELLNLSSEINTFDYRITVRDVIFGRSPEGFEQLQNKYEARTKQANKAQRAFWDESVFSEADPEIYKHVISPDRTEIEYWTTDGQLRFSISDALLEHYYGTENANRMTSDIIEARNIVANDWDRLENQIRAERQYLLTQISVFASITIASIAFITLLVTI